MLRYLLPLALVALAAAAVIEASDKDLDSYLKAGIPTILSIYATWCGHCKRFHPVFDELATLYEGHADKIQFIKIDGDSNRKAAKKFDVEYFPTIKWVDANGKNELIERRDVDSLKALIKDKTGLSPQLQRVEEGPKTKAIALNDATFDDAIKGKWAFIEFTAKWCAISTGDEMINTWEELAGVYEPDRDDLVIGTVDTTGAGVEELNERFGIRAFPTFLLFNPDGEFFEYRDMRELADFTTFINAVGASYREDSGQFGPYAGLIHELLDESKDLASASTDKITAFAERVAASGSRYADKYLRILEKLTSGGAAYVEKEAARLAKLVDAPAPQDKRDSIRVRLNILRSFLPGFALEPIRKRGYVPEDEAAEGIEIDNENVTEGEAVKINEAEQLNQAKGATEADTEADTEAEVEAEHAGGDPAKAGVNDGVAGRAAQAAAKVARDAANGEGAAGKVAQAAAEAAKGAAKGAVYGGAAGQAAAAAQAVVGKGNKKDSDAKKGNPVVDAAKGGAAGAAAGKAAAYVKDAVKDAVSGDAKGTAETATTKDSEPVVDAAKVGAAAAAAGKVAGKAADYVKGAAADAAGAAADAADAVTAKTATTAAGNPVVDAIKGGAAGAAAGKAAAYVKDAVYGKAETTAGGNPVVDAVKGGAAGAAAAKAAAYVKEAVYGKADTETGHPVVEAAGDAAAQAAAAVRNAAAQAQEAAAQAVEAAAIAKENLAKGAAKGAKAHAAKAKKGAGSDNIINKIIGAAAHKAGQAAGAGGEAAGAAADAAADAIVGKQEL